MNKIETRLAKKTLDSHKLGKGIGFSGEENVLLERWRVQGIINEDAFMDVTSHSPPRKEYIQGIKYPFTRLGEQERNKNWYLSFRDSRGIIIVRDMLTVIAFLISLYLAICQVFSK